LRWNDEKGCPRVTDEDLAARLAEGAGLLLLALRENGCLTGRALGAVADQVANAFILTALKEWRPEDAVLSEESPDNPARLERDRAWIVDPLDGTREYVEGRSDWAVHVALAVRGKPALGAVAVPALGRLHRSDGGAAPAASPRPRPLMLVSRTRAPAEAEALAALIGADIVPMGSAGAKAMAVVAGEADLYYHAGGQHEWDNCAPAAVALGAGLHASRIDGAPLAYNRPDTLVPDLVIGRPDLAARVIAFTQSQAASARQAANLDSNGTV
jgi:3'(2'), 5'-bisphosphate nucleotidase